MATVCAQTATMELDMVISNAWVIARNAHKRPTLCHRLNATGLLTVCGQDVSPWSRSYLSEPITSVTCKRCVAM